MYYLVVCVKHKNFDELSKIWFYENYIKFLVWVVNNRQM